MSFPVAVQSAIFYILACTPCMAARTRHRTKQQAKREREERARMDEEQPDLYRHPSPFNVNPYWQEEIMMGPSLPNKKQKAGSKNTSQRKLTSAGQDSSVATRSSIAVSHASGPAGATPGSPTLVPEDARSVSVAEGSALALSDGWNLKRYQREDEELWGQGLWDEHEQSRTHKLMDAIVKAGSSAGRLLESRLGKERPVTDEERANFYGAPTNPPVNDYHPPVVSSKPAHRDALRWMLQPPPSAKVMEGKVPVSRSTSIASSVSRRPATGATRAGSDASLGRIGETRRRANSSLGDGEKMLQPPAPVMGASSRPGSRRATTASMTRPKSQRSARSGSLSTESEGGSSESVGPKRRKRRAQPPAVTPELESEDDDTGYFGRQSSSAAPQTTKSTASTTPAAETQPAAESHAAQRPRLETIFSSDARSQADVAEEQDKENVRPSGKDAEGARREAQSDPIPMKERPSGPSIDSGLALSA